MPAGAPLTDPFRSQRFRRRGFDAQSVTVCRLRYAMSVSFPNARLRKIRRKGTTPVR